jgi:Zn-dependent protease
MYNGTIGSVSLGDWVGLPIRLHVSFLLLAVFVPFFMARGDFATMGGYAALLLFVWLLCVLLHEAGHCAAVARMGGTNDVLVLAPFGGLSYHSYTQDPRRELLVAAAGPLMNLGGLIAASLLLLGLRDVPLLPLLNPFNPRDLLADGPLVVIALRMAVWINWGLLLVNLLPATPFDAGWALRILLWPSLGDRQAFLILRRVTIASAVFLCLLAWWLGEAEKLAVPAWLPLLVIAAYCCCFTVAPRDTQYGLEEDDLFEHDFSIRHSKPAAILNPPSQEQGGPFRSWLRRRQMHRKQQLDKIEQDEESQIDEILQCVHERGMESLTLSQQQVLQRVAARYRARTPK